MPFLFDVDRPHFGSTSITDRHFNPDWLPATVTATVSDSIAYAYMAAGGVWRGLTTGRVLLLPHTRHVRASFKTCKAGQEIRGFLAGRLFAAANNLKMRQGIRGCLSFWVVCLLANNSSGRKPRRQGVFCRQTTSRLFARWVVCPRAKNQNDKQPGIPCRFLGCLRQICGLFAHSCQQTTLG